MSWTVEKVKELRELWQQGLTANEIAKKLGFTKNSIVGKVHRLALPPRPSPIKSKNADGKIESAPQKEAATKKTEAASKAVKKVSSAGTEAEKTAVAAEKTEVKTDAAPASAEVKPEAKAETPAKKKDTEKHVRLVDLDSHTCRWPIGDPRDEDFCFCGRKVRAGQTYCDEHAAIVYVKANRR